jgi:hypothetical protein
MASAPPPAAAAARTALARKGSRVLAGLRLLPARARHGRPLHLAARLAGAVLLVLVALHAGAGGPATVGVVAGLVLWCGLTVRGDLAPPPGR